MRKTNVNYEIDENVINEEVEDIGDSRQRNRYLNNNHDTFKIKNNFVNENKMLNDHNFSGFTTPKNHERNDSP